MCHDKPVPLFSVVIPTYDRRERLLRAARSVLAQRWTDYEIVVVDDGSTDGSAEAMRALAPAARIVVQANHGCSAARNAGTRFAAGSYVAFLDSDDAWLPWTLASYAAVIGEHAPTWLYASGSAELAQADAVAEEPLAAVRFEHYRAAASRDGLKPLPTGVAIRREALLRVGGFDERIQVGEDMDLWFRLSAEPGFVRMDAPVAVAREVHPDNLSRDLTRAVASMAELVRRERRHAYPGDPLLWRGMIASELMGYAWQCQMHARVGLAIRLYLRLLALQARSRFSEPAFGERRNRYLLTFPLKLASPRLHDRLLAAAARRRQRRALSA